MIFDDFDEIFKYNKIQFYDYIFSYLKDEDISYVVVTNKLQDKVKQKKKFYN